MQMNERINNELKNLEEKIISGDFVSEAQKARLWGGADVIIEKRMTPRTKRWLGDQPLVISFQQFAPRRRAVITPYARELSWLFSQLRDIYSRQIDYISKYDFFGLTAQTAMDYHENNPETNCKELLLAVIEGCRKFPTIPE